MEKVSKTGDKTPSPKRSFTMSLSFPIALSGVDVAFVMGPMSIWRNGELVGTEKEPGPYVVMDSGCEDAGVICIIPDREDGTEAWVSFTVFPTGEYAYTLLMRFEVEDRLSSGMVLPRKIRTGFVFENMREEDGSHGGFVIYRVIGEKYRGYDSKTNKRVAVPPETQEVARLLYDQKSHQYKLIRSPGFEGSEDGGIWDPSARGERRE
jgi:hypothetical protein